MSDQELNDQLMLIDYLLGRCDSQSALEVTSRLDGEPSFKRLHDDLANAFRAMSLSAAPQPPADLVDKTLARIGAARRTEALIVRQQLARPPIIPTFSMREMFAAAAAVLLIGVLFVPSIRHARNAARIQECSAQVGRIGTAMQSYANLNDGYLPAAEGRSERWLQGGRDTVSNSSALFKLLHQQYLDSPVLFQCPAVGGGGFEVKAGMTDFPAARYIGYSYQHMVGPQRMRISSDALAAVAANMAILADSNPVFSDGRFLPRRLQSQASDNHNRTGQNVLYLDNHVAWARTATVGVDADNIYLAKGITEYNGDEAPIGPTDSFLLPSYSPAGRQ